MSVSVTCAAKIERVQLSPNAKSTLGSTVKVVGPPVTSVSATLRVPLVAQTIWNQSPATVTASVNVIVRFALSAAVPPSAGTVAATAGAASTPKVMTWSAVIRSGGSPASWSVTCVATTVRVQLSPAAKSALGLTLNVVGPPVTAVSTTFQVPLEVQTIVNQLPTTSTGSVKVSVRSAAAETAPASGGTVDAIAGGESTVNANP